MFMVAGSIQIFLHPQGGAPGKLQVLILCLSGLLNNFCFEFTYFGIWHYLFIDCVIGIEKRVCNIVHCCFNQGMDTMHKKLMVQVVDSAV